MNLKNRWQQVVRGSLAVLSLTLLASCGGGKRQAFHPGHMYVFGDEYSYFDVNNGSSSNFKRYSLNMVLTVSGSTVTSYNPIYPYLWTDYVLSYYGKSPMPCSDSASNTASMCAEDGTAATVANTITAINAKSFQKDELVVIMAGTRDILNAYQDFKSGCGGSGCAITSLATTVTNAGITLGQKINAITTTGARVAVATIPDIGLSPYASGESGGSLRNPNQAMDCDKQYAPADNTPSNYSKALSYLTACFNYGLRGTNGIVNDGKKIALISTFDWSVLIVRNRSIAYPLDPACTAPTHNTAATYDPTQCYYDNVTTPGTPTTTAVNYPSSTYMWSFGPWLAPGGHALLGVKAVNAVNAVWGE